MWIVLGILDTVDKVVEVKVQEDMVYMDPVYRVDQLDHMDPVDLVDRVDHRNLVDLVVLVHLVDLANAHAMLVRHGVCMGAVGHPLLKRRHHNPARCCG